MPATLQLSFRKDDKGDTHFVCSDLTFVSRQAMNAETPCAGSLSGEAEAALFPAPASTKATLPTHGSFGSILGLLAICLFAYVSYFYILPRIRQRQKESGSAMEMAHMMS
jgi:hypothetical protein